MSEPMDDKRPPSPSDRPWDAACLPDLDSEDVRKEIELMGATMSDRQHPELFLNLQLFASNEGTDHRAATTEQTGMEGNSLDRLGLQPHEGQTTAPGKASKPRQKKAAPSAQDSPTQKIVSPLPTSQVTDLAMSALIGGRDNIERIPEMKTAVSHGVEMDYKAKGDMRELSYSKGGDSISLGISDITKLCGTNKSAKRLFLLILQKANEQALHDGHLTRDSITFPLKELVDLGIYSRPQSARTGFNDGMDILTSLKVKGSITKHTKKGEKHVVDTMAVLFTTSRIKNGQCTVFLNYNLDWGFVVQYFTCIPRYYYSLPNTAADLLYYIFYMARQGQNMKKIAETGSFTISYQAIHTKLALPDPSACPNPQRDIKDRIAKAIEDIEEAHWSTCKNKDLQLLPICDEEASARQFINSGKLKVTLKNDFAENFIKISDSKQKKIEAIQKRKDKVADRARAAYLEKKMTEEEKQD